MNAHENGGPAFPRDHRHEGHNGMTMRDYFAAHAPALPRFVLDSFVSAGKKGADMDLQEHAITCARWARLYADAMLKERDA